jgi:hypothetical protein
MSVATVCYNKATPQNIGTQDEPPLLSGSHRQCRQQATTWSQLQRSQKWHTDERKSTIFSDTCDTAGETGAVKIVQKLDDS